MRLIVAPDVDMLAVSKSSRIQRRSILGFAPIGLSIVDYQQLDAIDTFYLECQNFRDYYRDSHNQLHRPVSFSKHVGLCGSRLVDLNTALLRQPTTWVRERQPTICPCRYNRSPNYDGQIFLGGQYSPTSSISYKR